MTVGLLPRIFTLVVSMATIQGKMHGTATRRFADPCRLISNLSPADSRVRTEIVTDSHSIVTLGHWGAAGRKPNPLGPIAVGAYPPRPTIKELTCLDPIPQSDFLPRNEEFHTGGFLRGYAEN